MVLLLIWNKSIKNTPIKVLVLLFSIKLMVIAKPMRETFFDQDQIIQLPTSNFPEPECNYNVLYGNANGMKVSSEVSIGEPLYHKWKCGFKGKEVKMYCLMVHNCTVSHSKNDYSNRSVPIIDEFGCSLFPTVIPHISYPAGDLEGGLSVNAFSLDIDKPALFFQCNIKLLIKLNNVCRRPNCVPLSKFTEEEQ
uniref:ZP domain-containing protein n=1 Tax=Rhabditophanes sp. KR3021 TaxID=114890 RepID=A0AC35TX72_9BILA